jgi:glycosyltransferase involved in cell wall biosynthesis
LLDDPSLAERLGETGRRRAMARFDWSATTGSYAPLLTPASN